MKEFFEELMENTHPHQYLQGPVQSEWLMEIHAINNNRDGGFFESDALNEADEIFSPKQLKFGVKVNCNISTFIFLAHGFL